MGRNKYGAVKTMLDGIEFDSQREAQRYWELKMLQKAGEISDLRMQVRFELIPKQPKMRAVYYIADFVYTGKDGTTVVEDAKGMKTREYVLKKKMMLFLKGIEVVEV